MIDNVVVCCGYGGEKIFARSLFQRRFRIMIEKPLIMTSHALIFINDELSKGGGSCKHMNEPRLGTVPGWQCDFSGDIDTFYHLSP